MAISYSIGICFDALVGHVAACLAHPDRSLRALPPALYCASCRSPFLYCIFILILPCETSTILQYLQIVLYEGVLVFSDHPYEGVRIGNMRSLRVSV